MPSAKVTEGTGNRDRDRRKDPALAMVPLAVRIVLFALVPSLTSSTSYMIIPSGALAILLAWLKYRKETKGAAAE